jgi:hypothetical protein
MSGILYIIKDQGLELLVRPTRWLYSHGKVLPIEGIDANGAMYTMSPQVIISLYLDVEFDKQTA